jgi:hypothetical protein
MMPWRFDRSLDWMREAACVGWDPDAFFGGERGGRPALRRLPCGHCTVTAECLLYGRKHQGVQHGVWGGVLVNSPGQQEAPPEAQAQAEAEAEGEANVT